MKFLFCLALLGVAFFVGLYIENIYDLLPKPKAKAKGLKNIDNAIFNNLTYPYKLPELGYSYDALEPHLDAETMTTHHTKHHQTYIDNLNKGLAEHAQYQSKSLAWLVSHLDELPAALRKVVQNHGGGHFNHSLFWQLMKPQGGGQPVGTLKTKIDETFGSFEECKKAFDKAATTVFGSGWAWLCVDENKKLMIVSTSNQDTPLELGLLPVLALDVWEHAYYLKYKNKRADYTFAWWNVVDWKRAEELYQQHVK